jgi:hypothetical protein
MTVRAMRNRGTLGTTHHFSATDEPLVYGVRIQAMLVMKDSPRAEYVMKDTDVPGFIRQLQGSYDAIQHRRLIDSVCGDCSLCGNTRMVNVPRHGRDWLEHCSRCAPKIERAKARGTLP